MLNIKCHNITGSEGGWAVEPPGEKRDVAQCARCHTSLCRLPAYSSCEGIFVLYAGVRTRQSYYQVKVVTAPSR